MKTQLFLACLAAIFVAVPSSAQSPDEIREQLSKVEERTRQAKSDGRIDEVRELTHQAEQLRHAGQMAAVKREIEELHRAGKHEEAERLGRKIAETHKERAPGKRKPAPEGAERLHHLGEAIRQLRQAGLDEQAEDLERLAHRMKEEMARHEREARGAAMPDVVQEVMARNKAELQAMREQIQKLAHAIEELRGQLQSQRPGKP